MVATSFSSGPITSRNVEWGTTAPERREQEADGGWRWPLPLGGVLAVFGDRASALGALAALRDAGEEPRAIWMASGVDGARRLGETFARRGLFGRLRSLLGDEGEVVSQLQAWSARGATVVLLHPSGRQVGDVLDLLAQHEARLMRSMGRWVTEWVAQPALQPA